MLCLHYKNSFVYIRNPGMRGKMIAHKGFPARKKLCVAATTPQFFVCEK